MKRKILYAALFVVLGAVALFGILVYQDFHSDPTFISRHPVSNRVVDCINDGFVDISYHFRAHDLKVSLLKPVLVGDLEWEERYSSGSLFWSRDGSVAAASIILKSERREALACAYDFREHRVIRNDSRGSPLDGSKDAEIRRLLETRGGSTQHSMTTYKGDIR